MALEQNVTSSLLKHDNTKTLEQRIASLLLEDDSTKALEQKIASFLSEHSNIKFVNFVDECEKRELKSEKPLKSYMYAIDIGKNKIDALHKIGKAHNEYFDSLIKFVKDGFKIDVSDLIVAHNPPPPSIVNKSELGMLKFVYNNHNDLISEFKAYVNSCNNNETLAIKNLIEQNANLGESIKQGFMDYVATNVKLKDELVTIIKGMVAPLKELIDNCIDHYDTPRSDEL